MFEALAIAEGKQSGNFITVSNYAETAELAIRGLYENAINEGVDQFRDEEDLFLTEIEVFDNLEGEEVDPEIPNDLPCEAVV